MNRNRAFTMRSEKPIGIVRAQQKPRRLENRMRQALTMNSRPTPVTAVQSRRNKLYDT